MVIGTDIKEISVYRYVMRLIVTVFLLFNISNAKIFVDGTDRVYNKKILGLWNTEVLNYNGLTLYTEYIYHIDGTKNGINQICVFNKCTKEYFKSKWYIEDGFLYSIVLESTSSDLPIGLVIKDKIIKLDKDEMVLLSKFRQEKNKRLVKPKLLKL